MEEFIGQFGMEQFEYRIEFFYLLFVVVVLQELGYSFDFFVLQFYFLGYFVYEVRSNYNYFGMDDDDDDRIVFQVILVVQGRVVLFVVVVGVVKQQYLLQMVLVVFLKVVFDQEFVLVFDRFDIFLVLLFVLFEYQVVVDFGFDFEVKVDMVVFGMVDQELMLEFGMFGLFAREVRDFVQVDQGKVGLDLKIEVDKIDQDLKQVFDMVDLDMVLFDIVDLIDEEYQVLLIYLRSIQN